MERARAARVLGVDITATPEQVRDAFRRRAREVHPDRVGGDTAAMADLNAAYEALSALREPNWQFVIAPQTSDTWSDQWIHPPDDEEAGSPSGDLRLLRFFGVALVVVGVVSTTIVFIAAIGYDWSLSP
jgi:hypothetical protein